MCRDLSFVVVEDADEGDVFIIEKSLHDDQPVLSPSSSSRMLADLDSSWNEFTRWLYKHSVCSFI